MWKNIETAPRDGTHVDLFHKTAGRIVDLWWVEEDQCWSHSMTDVDFTHWMEIPDDPNY